MPQAPAPAQTEQKVLFFFVLCLCQVRTRATAVSVGPPSCLTVSRRYGTENMTNIHSEHALVLVFVPWMFSLCRSKICAGFTILRYRVTFVLGMAGRQWPCDTVEWTCTCTLRKVVNRRGTKSVMLELLWSESCSASTCKERLHRHKLQGLPDNNLTPRISTSGVFERCDQSILRRDPCRRKKAQCP